jgi:tetratricopeptide (TPR) repeat protein
LAKDKSIMDTAILAKNESIQIQPSSSAPLSLALVPQSAQRNLLRMFADPRVLSKEESAELVEQLGDCVEQNPKDSDLRVIYGMALCVNLEAQEAMEELGEAVRLSPNSYIAHLKMGELWMRLRVMNKAEYHTHQAAMLSQNLAQSDLARRQAATIRTMLQHGIERGGYMHKTWLSFSRLRRLFTRRQHEELATVEVQ